MSRTRDKRTGREKLDCDFIKVYRGVGINKGEKYSQLLGTLLYKYDYWEYQSSEKNWQDYQYADCYFYVTQFELTEDSLLSPSQYEPVLDLMKEDGLIDFIKQTGKAIRIKVNYKTCRELIVNSDNKYIRPMRINRFARMIFKKFKQSVTQPTVSKIKNTIEEFLKVIIADKEISKSIDEKKTIDEFIDRYIS